MTDASREKPRRPDRLSVRKILNEFQKSEESATQRKGTFKINMPFEDALKIVAHAKPEPKKVKHSRRTAKLQDSPPSQVGVFLFRRSVDLAGVGVSSPKQL